MPVDSVAAVDAGAAVDSGTREEASRAGRPDGRFGLGGRRGRRTGALIGMCAPTGPGGGGTLMPSRGASPGTFPHCCRAASSNSGGTFAGSPSGFTVRRTGLSAMACKTTSHLSGEADGDKAAPAASLSRVASSAEKRAVGSGGRLDRRKARTTWPSSRCLVTSLAQLTRCASTRCSSNSRNATTNSREASSRAASDPLTRARKSRIANSSPALMAASARSRHSAPFTAIRAPRQ